MTDPDIDRAVRRSVGIAALRRLQRMVAADRAQRETEARWAVRIGWAALLAAAFAVAWLALR